jgi:hypothetical protein
LPIFFIPLNEEKEMRGKIIPGKKSDDSVEAIHALENGIKIMARIISHYGKPLNSREDLR